MIGHYEIHQARNLIRVVYSGNIGVEQEIDFIEEILADPRFRPGMDSISDLTRGVFDWDVKDIEHFQSYVNSLGERFGASRWALVSNHGITHANATMFAILQEIYGDSISVRLFTNEHDAVDWLQKPRNATSG
jgi:methyl coenzyme M reductase alpha subunit